jgi:hypothetical protein
MRILSMLGNVRLGLRELPGGYVMIATQDTPGRLTGFRSK